MITYYDDILNVAAYLRQKSKASLEESELLLSKQKALQTQQRELSGRLDETLKKARQLADALGCDIPEIPQARDAKVSAANEMTIDEKIYLPKDFDFTADFERLREEAHAEGFTDVHPEELLTSEEMARAQQVSAQLDLQFEQASGLRGKDILIMTIATAVRVLLSFIMVKDNASHEPLQPVVMEPKVDASAGVDINHLIKNANSYKDTVSSISSLASHLGGRRTTSISIKSSQSILDEPVPFDVPDDSIFLRKDIAGYDKYLGWIVGVMNLMTSTITTKQFHSYKTNNSASVIPKAFDGQEISTVTQIVYPILKNVSSNKEAIVAGMVREACVLGITSAPPENLKGIMSNVMSYNERCSSLFSKVESINRSIGQGVINFAGNIAVMSFLNILVSALYAILYDPKKDGSLDAYAIRTNKVLTYSCALATIANSIPAILSEDIRNIDWSGVLMTLLGTVESTRFWIEAKARFLTSEYKTEIDKLLSELNEYFVYT